METTRATTHRAVQLKQELLYYSFALRHITNRLRALTPGVNAKLNTYVELLQERDQLTQRLQQVIISLYGGSYVDVCVPYYLYNGIPMPLEYVCLRSA